MKFQHDKHAIRYKVLLRVSVILHVLLKQTFRCDWTMDCVLLIKQHAIFQI